jgi:tRNA modification GTPase
LDILTEDTIVGISTALGGGGIAIIKVSGSNAISLIKKIFVGKINKNIESHKIYYGNIIDENNILIDEVLVTIMLAPKTYTCENVVEINCHGGVKTVDRVMQEILKHDVRLAEPGEFTKRAFLNGRIDLTQAEAIIDVINAKTDAARESSVKQLSGELSKSIKNYRLTILTLLAHIEASIDYPEHEEEENNLKNILEKCEKLTTKINNLINTFEKGKMIKDGLQTVIIGKPNVGKSSLLNEILKEDRAIVTDIAGTTRDILSEYVNIKNILLKLTDTAGIRETNDAVEKIGVEKSKLFLNKADLIIMVIDSSSHICKQDIDILESIKNKKFIIIVNKIDLLKKVDIKKLEQYIDKEFIIEVSIKEKLGIKKIESALEKMFFEGDISKDDETIITSVRHKNSLTKALNSLKNIKDSIAMGFTEDIIAIDLQDAYKYLGEIIGESVEEELLDMIFSEFCLGK